MLQLGLFLISLILALHLFHLLLKLAKGRAHFALPEFVVVVYHALDLGVLEELVGAEAFEGPCCGLYDGAGGLRHLLCWSVAVMAAVMLALALLVFVLGMALLGLMMVPLRESLGPLRRPLSSCAVGLELSRSLLVASCSHGGLEPPCL